MQNWKFNLIPLQYNPADKSTSFDTYQNDSDVFLIFNDNAHQADVELRSPFRWGRGSGNAIARPYRNAYGIPTGKDGIGFRGTDGEFSYIESHLVTLKMILWHRYVLSETRNKLPAPDVDIMYSASNDGYTLGSGTFQVSFEVLSYITYGLHSIVAELNDAIVAWSNAGKL